MSKIRIVAEIDDDIFDELYSYVSIKGNRVSILYAEDADGITPSESKLCNFVENVLTTLDE